MTKIPLILLPGLLCDEEVWAHQSDHLKDVAEIIVPNLTKANSPDAMVSAVLEVAPPTFALAGISMGGWVAIEVAKASLSRITKLCLINTTSDNDTIEKRDFRLNLIKEVRQGQISAIVDQLATLYTLDTPVRNKARQMFIRNQAAFIDQETAMLIRDDSLSFLPTINCPTLLIHATNDQIFPLGCFERLLKAISTSKLALIENSGHLVTMEQPEAITALMRFWLDYF